MELIEQNESCTETKRDRKAKGREENLMRGEEEKGVGERGRVCRGETDTRRRKRRHNHVYMCVWSSGEEEEEEEALCIKRPDEISSIRPL